MAVSMWVQEEGAATGVRLAESRVPWSVMSDALNATDTPLLSGVDWAGDTIFNRIQIARLLPREVDHLRARLLQPEHQEMLDELERLMTMALKDVHRYLWFVGL
jgi:hypothetical protein